jgi:hypothetical protein
MQKAKEVGAGLEFGRFNGKTGSYILGDDTVDGDVVAWFEFMDSKFVWLGFDPDNNPVRGPEAFIAKGEDLAEPDRSNIRIKWNKQMVIPLVTTEGKRVIYSSKADAGYRPVLKLMAEYGNQVMRRRDAQGRPMVPVVSMSALEKSRMVEEDDPAGFKRKVKVTFYSEVFKIIDWTTVDDVMDAVSGVGPEEGDEPDMVEVNHVEEAEYVVIDAAPQKPATPTGKAPAARPTTNRFNK